MYHQVVKHKGEDMPWIQQIKREGEPIEIVTLICWVLCDESQYITGSVQQIDGGWAC